MNDKIDKREIKANKLGIVKFAASVSRLTLIDVELRHECIMVGIVPIRSTLNTDLHQQPTDDWLCYCDKFRELKEAEVIPIYEIEFERKNNIVSVKSIIEKKLTGESHRQSNRI